MNRMEEMQERINLLEAEIETLKQPQLMYRRPNSTKYEKVTDFLDDIELRLRKVEEHGWYIRHFPSICYHCVCGVYTDILENTW